MNIRKYFHDDKYVILFLSVLSSKNLICVYLVLLISKSVVSHSFIHNTGLQVSIYAKIEMAIVNKNSRWIFSFFFTFSLFFFLPWGDRSLPPFLDAGVKGNICTYS